MAQGSRERKRREIIESASVQGAKEPEKLDWELFQRTGVLDQTLADKVTRSSEAEALLQRKLDAITANGGKFIMESMRHAERR